MVVFDALGENSARPASFCSSAYLLLGFTTANSVHPRCRLDDFENACAAYDKAVQLAGEPGEAIFHLNYGAYVAIFGLGRMFCRKPG